MYKYIIVDDEDILRKGICKKISALNLPLLLVGEAQNGEDAIGLMAAERPDIVITDMRMPVLDGKMLLKVIQSDYPNIKIIVISGFTDFEYMQEAISAHVVSYLLKPFSREELHKALDKAISLMQRDRILEEDKMRLDSEKEGLCYNMDIQYIVDSLMGHKVISPEVFKSQRLHSVFANCTHYYLAICHITKDITEPEYKVIEKTLSSRISVVPVRHNSFGSNLLLFVCCLTTNGLYESSVDELVGILRTPFDHMPAGNMLFGISSVKTSLKELNHAYKECHFAIDSRLVSANPEVNYYKSKIQTPEGITWNSEDQLLFHIESGNAERVQELTDELFSTLLFRPNITFADIKHTCKHIFNSVRSLLQDRYAEVFRTTAVSSFDTAMGSIFDVQTIKSYVLNTLANVSRMMKELNIYPEDELVSNLRKYIEQNYTKEIKLQKLSDLFFINPSYCSYIFKQKTGFNISEYITGLRMEKAKKLLLCTNYEIYSIAKMLGYDNTKYFFRVFKRIAGTTPDKYRQEQKQP